MSTSKRWQPPRLLLMVVGLLLPLWLTIVSANTPPASTTRISVSSDGSQAETESNVYYGYYGPVHNINYHSRFISDDGEKIVFATASALVPEDTNGYLDIYLHTRSTATTTRISRAYDGGNPNGLSGVYGVTISNDGNIIAFASDASNLVPDDTNGKQDVFVYDQRIGEIERVSLTAEGTQSNFHSLEPVLDGDGSQIVFHRQDSVSNGGYVLLNRTTNEQQPACYAQSPTNNMCNSPTFSADGRFLAYQQYVVTNQSTYSIVVFDIENQTTELVAVGLDGNPVDARHPSLSADGRYVAFSTPSTRMVPNDVDGNVDGNEDVFRFDRQTDTLIQVSLNSEGISPDGNSRLPVLSADGNQVAFLSSAWDMIVNDSNDSCATYPPYGYRHNPDAGPFGYIGNCTDAFIKDIAANEMRRVSVAFDGTQANAGTLGISLSANGRIIAFVSPATNLVPNDTNEGCSYSEYYTSFNCTDLFVHTLEDSLSIPALLASLEATPPLSNPRLPILRQLSQAPDGETGNGYSIVTPNSLSRDGRYTVFTSAAGNLNSGDWNAHTDIYFFDLEQSELIPISRRADGQQGNGDSFSAVVSGNGAWIAFYSSAMLTPNLTTRDVPRLFLWERQTSTLTSLPVQATPLPEVPSTPDSDYLAERLTFTDDGNELLLESSNNTLVLSDTNEVTDLFVYNTTDATFERVSVTSSGGQANGASRFGVISADGRFIAFYSDASNLVPDDTNEMGDLFLYDRILGTVERIGDVGDYCVIWWSCGGFAGLLSISDDGRYVGFNTAVGSNVCVFENPPYPPSVVPTTDFYLYDRTTQAIRLVSTDPSGQALVGNSIGQLSGNGQFAIFTTKPCHSSTRETSEVNLSTGEISLRPFGEAITTALSQDGTVSAYTENSQVYLDFPLPEGWHQRFLPLIQK